MRSLWRLFGYLGPYFARMAAASVMLAVSGALMAVVVSTAKPLVNEVLLPGISGGTEAASEPGGPDILTRAREWVPVDRMAAWARDNAFVQVPLLIMALFFLRGVLLYFGQYFTIRSGACVIRDLRADLYEKVAFQSLGFFQQHATGVIVARIVHDVSRLQRITTMLLADLVRVAAMVPFLLLTAFYHDWRMSLMALVALPLLGFPMLRLGRRLRRAATASLEHMSTLTSVLTESVTGVTVVQAFGMERYEVRRFGSALNGMLRAELRAGRAQALAPAVMELLSAAVGAALFSTAGWQISRGNLDPGNFAVVLFCLGLLFISTRKLTGFYSEIQAALAAAVRVFEMLDRQPEVCEQADARPLPRFHSGIRFDRVQFGYGDERVLRDIDLTIEPGQTVALVGRSGSGKSTLANLLPRFYDPSEGRVLIDGRDIRTVTLESLRAQIGLVTQETVLFDDTVRNNIAYGRSTIPLERVVEVARACQAHRFIERLPQGYDTRLGERGARLSMGERQRITIARALLKDPPLLILDEATSALDSESEALVQQALEMLMRGRTSIVIAHRLHTVRNADRILVVDSGRIVEHGSHAELLARDGAFARIYELQFKGAHS